MISKQGQRGRLQAGKLAHPLIDLLKDSRKNKKVMDIMKFGFAFARCQKLYGRRFFTMPWAIIGTIFAATLAGHSSIAFAQSSLPSLTSDTRNVLVAPSSAPAITIGHTVSIPSGVASSILIADGLDENGVGTSAAPTMFPNNAEIKALARALDYDPERIFDWVHDNVSMHYVYGMSKGAFGALSDKNGTAFDQAALVVALLREANNQPGISITVSYQIGSAQLNSTQFVDWFGLSNARAACEFLASGGFPATVNEGTSCASIGSAINSVSIAHVWLKVVVDGVTTVWDPAYKSHSFYPGMDVRSEAGYVAGAARNAVTLSSEQSQILVNGVQYPYVSKGNYYKLNGDLDSNAALLDQAMENRRGESLEQMIGGAEITPAFKTNAAKAPLSYTVLSGGADLLEIPDQFRIRLTYDLHEDISSLGVPIISSAVFADEVYGRRFGYVVGGFGSDATRNGSTATLAVELQLDGKVVQIAGDVKDYSHALTSLERQDKDLDITVDHPYGAYGTYMDDSYTQNVSLVSDVFLVTGWGKTSPDLLSRWTSERGASDDQTMPAHSNQSPFPNGFVTYLSNRRGDVVRHKVAASYLAQFSQMVELQAAVGDSRVQHHHTIGVSFASATVIPVPLPQQVNAVTVSDMTGHLDLRPAISVTSETSNTVRANAVGSAIAAAGAQLEGSVFQQLLNSPDAPTTAERFVWANHSPGYPNVPAGHHSGGAANPSKFYLFKPPNGVDPDDDPYDIVNDVGNETSGVTFGIYGADILQQSINDYIDAGYSVVAPEGSYLGPGSKCGRIEPPGDGHSPGVCVPHYLRGGALIANRPGNVAHAVTYRDFMTKGGGSVGLPDDALALNAPTTADLLKDESDISTRFDVDARGGRVTYSTGELLKIGGGDFPNSLSLAVSYDEGGATANATEWKHNWEFDVSLSGSGHEAMGASLPKNAAASLVAFMALQDTYELSTTTDHQIILSQMTGAFTSYWWGRQIDHNVATVKVASRPVQFVRRADGGFNAPPNSLSKLTQSGTRVYDAPPEGVGSAVWMYKTPGNTVSFSLETEDKDTLSFGYWSYTAPPTTANPNPNGRPNNSGWQPLTWTFKSGQSIDFTNKIPDASFRRSAIESIQNNVGRSLTFNYNDPVYEVVVSSASGGGSVSWTSIRAGQRSKIKHVDGNVSEYDFIAAPTGTDVRPGLERAPLLSALYQPSDTLNPVVKFEYDPAWNIKTTQIAQDTGGFADTTYRVAGGRRSEIIDADGVSTQALYDENGNVLWQRGALGWLGLTTYNGLGQVLETRSVHEDVYAADLNAFARRSTSSYDANGAQVCSAQHAAGDFSTSCPSPAGGALKTTTVYGNTTFLRKPTKITSPGLGVQNFSYNANGQLAHSDGPQTVDYTYTTDGLPLTISETLGALQTGGASAIRVTDFIDPITALPSYVNGLPTRKTVSGGGLSQTTNFTWSAPGDLLSITSPLGRKTTAQYDPSRRLTHIIKGANNTAQQVTSAFTYDANGRINALKEGQAGIITPLITNAANWHTTSVAYTKAGRVSAITDPSGDVDQFFYTPGRRLERTIDGSSRAAKTLYNERGDVVGDISGFGSANPIQRHQTSYALPGERTRLRQAKGIAAGNTSYDTDWTYDDFGRVSSIIFPGGSFESFTYDADGNVLTQRKRGGAIVSFTYDAFGRPLTKAYPGGSYTFTYNASGMALTSSKTSGGLTEDLAFIYDGLGRVSQRLSTVTPTSGNAVAYTQDFIYDNDNLPTALNYSACRLGNCASAASIDTIYDALGRATTMTFPGGSAAFEYENNSARLAGRHYGGADATSSAASMLYAYAADGDMTQLSYDLASRPGDPVTFDFTNDASGRLIGESISDPAWLWQPGTARQTSYDPANTLDQLSAYTRTEGVATPEDVTLCYDASGNVSGQSTNTANVCGAPVRAYTHDAQNRMTAASDSVTAMNASYVYGAEESRIYKQYGTVSNPGGYRFSNLNDQVLGEHPGTAGSALGSWHLYVPGIGVDDRVAMVTMDGSTATAVSYYLPNRIGSIVGMVDGAAGANFGVLTDQYLYSPFGVEEPLAGSGNPYRYTGRYYDAETGLYYYRARYYDPGVGRFGSPDPIGYDDQFNLYAYVGNNPINNVDPMGLETGVIKLNVDLFVGVGISVDVGIFFGGPSLEDTKKGGFLNGFDIGFVASVEVGAGLDVSAGLGGFLVDASPESLNGGFIESEAGIGPLTGGVGSTSDDSGENLTPTFNFGVDIGPLPGSANVTAGAGKKFGIQDVKKASDVLFEQVSNFKDNIVERSTNCDAAQDNC